MKELSKIRVNSCLDCHSNSFVVYVHQKGCYTSYEYFDHFENAFSLAFTASKSEQVEYVELLNVMK